MEHIGAFEAKTHFSYLLGRVMVGEQIIITKHRKNVARLVPYFTLEKPVDFSRTIAAMRNLRQKVSVSHVSLQDIQAMKEEGRA